MAARQVNIDSLLEFEVITDLLEENDNNKIYDDSGIVFGVASKKEKVANVSNFAEETVPGMDDNEFRRHFRIGKSVFNILIQEFEPFLVRHIGGREPLSVYKQLLIFLWHISTLESMRETANIFGVSTSTVHDCVQTTAKTISDHAHKFIKWPKQDRRNEIATSFQDASRIYIYLT